MDQTGDPIGGMGKVAVEDWSFVPETPKLRPRTPMKTVKDWSFEGLRENLEAPDYPSPIFGGRMG